MMVIRDDSRAYDLTDAFGLRGVSFAVRIDGARQIWRLVPSSRDNFRLVKPDGKSEPVDRDTALALFQNRVRE